MAITPKFKMQVLGALPKKGKPLNAEVVAKKLGLLNKAGNVTPAVSAKINAACAVLVSESSAVGTSIKAVPGYYMVAPETFELQVFAALPYDGLSAAMKEIAGNLGLLRTEGVRTFVPSVVGTKIRKTLDTLITGGKAIKTGKLSTTRYAKA